MPDRLTPSEVEDAAMLWLVRSDRGLTDGEQIEFNAWLEEESRNLGAFVRAQAAWIHAERASALGELPKGIASPTRAVAVTALEATDAEPPPHWIARRSLLAGGAAIAASLSAAAYLSFDRYRTIESSVGEIRRLTLAGRTTLTLDTDTRVDVTLDGDERRLTLVRGRLFLDVLAHGGRALTIRAQGLAMAMAEGAFAIQLLTDAPLVALITKGDLLVSEGSLFGGRRALTIGAERALTIPKGAHLSQARVDLVDAAKREQLLAWRDGLIAFSGESLGTAVRAFDRYGPARIIVTQPDLADEKVIGLFRADNPRGFAAAVAASFGALAAERGDVISIYRKNG